jgi:hypothetical protein
VSINYDEFEDIFGYLSNSGILIVLIKLQSASMLHLKNQSLPAQVAVGTQEWQILSAKIQGSK